MDTYLTLKEFSKGIYKERGSKFIALAYPITTQDEIKHCLNELKKEYYDARHLCYAYQLGADKKIFRCNDDGEPSGTAGLPILGQLRSFNLTNLLIVVVRYFGGTKLGVSGLVTAYKLAAKDAIEQGIIEEQYVYQRISIQFNYENMNEIMRIIKELEIPILSSSYTITCSIDLDIWVSKLKKFITRVEKIEGTSIIFF